MLLRPWDDEPFLGAIAAIVDIGGVGETLNPHDWILPWYKLEMQEHSFASQVFSRIASRSMILKGVLHTHVSLIERILLRQEL